MGKCLWLVTSLIHDPKCVSSSPTQTRIKLPCFYLQLTITMEIVDGANLKVLELSVIGKARRDKLKRLNNPSVCLNPILTKVLESDPLGHIWLESP